jgi:hypothetical protein
MSPQGKVVCTGKMLVTAARTRIDQSILVMVI